jgi:DNA-directed RNA polymerase specialized sigma24 family protein
LNLSQKVTKKEVTDEKFAGFLAWLSPEREKSGEEYERLRFRLITFFSHRNCSFAEDLADETINRVCLKIGAEVVVNKMAFVYGFAKNVYLESLRKEKNHQSIGEIKVAAKEPNVETNFPGDCLDKCLNELPADNKSLILEYFSEDKQAKIDLHKQISAKLEMTQTALRMRIVRIKQRLKACLDECLA